MRAGALQVSQRLHVRAPRQRIAAPAAAALKLAAPTQHTAAAPGHAEAKLLPQRVRARGSAGIQQQRAGADASCGAQAHERVEQRHASGGNACCAAGLPSRGAGPRADELALVAARWGSPKLTSASGATCPKWAGRQWFKPACPQADRFHGNIIAMPGLVQPAGPALQYEKLTSGSAVSFRAAIALLSFCKSWIRDAQAIAVGKQQQLGEGCQRRYSRAL